MTSQTTDETALHLVLAMHRLVRSIRASMPNLIAHPTQLIVLAQLAESGPMRIGELASRVPCSQPTATTVANGLEASGLVQRVPDTSDGRAIRLRITDLGRDTIISVAHDQAAVLRERLDGLNETDRATVLAAVPLLYRMAHPDWPPTTPCPTHPAANAEKKVNENNPQAQ